MSNVLISVASEFQKKGFQQAESHLGKLGKSIVKATSAFVTLHQAQKAMLNYIADEKATKVLAQNLKNLGLEFAIQNSEKFIKTLEAQTGVLDDELRPAYAQLARVTGSTIETQNLMALAFDVSAGSGTDYAQVIDALSQAYVGNNKGLKQLNIGLSQADLKAKSFAEITAILNKQFAGAGDASLDSYAGKMAQLQVATANASETIGKGLLDALTAAGGSNGFPKFISNINSAAQVISDLAIGIGRTIALIDITASPSKGIGDMIKKYRALRKKWDAEDLQAMKERNGIADNTSSYMEKQAKDALFAAKTSAVQKKLEADRLALLRKQTAEKLNQAKLDKAAAALGKAQGQFDLEKIQLAAAAKNATGEDLLRIKLKQEILALEDAIQAKNGDLATKLAATVTSDAARLAELIKQNAELDKMVKSYDSIISKEVVINFTATGLGAILDASGGLTGRGNVVIPKEISGSSSSSNSSSSASSSAAAAAAAVSSASSAAAATSSAAAAAAATAETTTATATAVADAVQTTNEVLGDLVTQTDVLTKDATDAANAITTITDASESLASVLAETQDIINSVIIDATNAAAEIADSSLNASVIPNGAIIDMGGILEWLLTSSAQGKQDTPPVVVNITENATGLIDLVVNGLQQQDASGISTRIQRNTGGFGG